MADKTSPVEVVARMLKVAGKVENVGEMPPVGTFANYYAEQIADEITEDNVEAFLYGAAVVNLIIQEAVLRVSMASKECVAESDSKEASAFHTGTAEGAFATARLIGETVDRVMKKAAEQPAINRQFNEIIADLIG